MKLKISCYKYLLDTLPPPWVHLSFCHQSHTLASIELTPQSFVFPTHCFSYSTIAYTCTTLALFSDHKFARTPDRLESDGSPGVHWTAIEGAQICIGLICITQASHPLLLLHLLFFSILFSPTPLLLQPPFSSTYSLRAC